MLAGVAILGAATGGVGYLVSWRKDVEKQQALAAKDLEVERKIRLARDDYVKLVRLRR